MKRIMTKVMLAACLLPNIVLAQEGGDPTWLIQQLEQEGGVQFANIKSAIVNIVSLGFILYAVISAVVGIVRLLMGQKENNPSKAQELKKSGLNGLLAGAGFALGTVFVNIILSLLGIGGFIRF